MSPERICRTWPRRYLLAAYDTVDGGRTFALMRAGINAGGKDPDIMACMNDVGGPEDENQTPCGEWCPRFNVAPLPDGGGVRVTLSCGHRDAVFDVAAEDVVDGERCDDPACCCHEADGVEP